MNLLDKLENIKSRLFKKNNIPFITILSLILFAIFICLTMIYFVYEFKKENINKNIDARTLIVNGEEEKYDLINKIEHVELNVSTKYFNDLTRDVAAFDTENLKGFVYLRPLLNNEDISIRLGAPLKKTGEVICPQRFYPYSLYPKNEKETMKYYPSKYLDGEDLIGTKFKVESRNPEFEEIELKIVGTYDSSKSKNYVNTCYISIKDFDSIASPYFGSTYTEYIDGRKEYTYEEYTGRMVRVDYYKNVEKVKQELNKLGFMVEDGFKLNEPMLQFILFIPMFVSLIIMILSLNIFYSFSNKKIQSRKNQYGILKSCGFEKIEIEKLEILENTIIFLISFVFAFLFYIMIFQIILRFFLFEFTYNNIKINIPYFWIFVHFMLLLFIGNQILKFKMKKILTLNSNDLLRN